MAVIDASIQKESRDRYLTYALSVVSGRALPDARDGLKPVQRRILYAMSENLKLRPSENHRKSAAVVGEVLARFHPHGDSACYDALVRMAQDFSLRYPLIDGQGNFGSLDGDSPAAYRYTEAKLREMAVDVMGEIQEETVDFIDNFDGTTREPRVLPSRIPNLLANGASGIAVGMATSIPPHNLRDIIKALLELSNNTDVSNKKLASLVKAPDFPTGCLILSTPEELQEMYSSGRGSVKMRSAWEPETGSRGKNYIIVTSIPYAINKSNLVEKIAELIIQKKVPQLVDIRDESTDIVRVVLELAPGAEAEVAMAFLFKHTELEKNFSVNITALVPTANGSLRPELLSLRDCLQHFLNFREEVTHKKLTFEKKKLLERIHILEGLQIVYDALDEALKIVRKSDGRSDAAAKLKKRFKLTEIQSFAVVDMRIYQLSKTNIEEILTELAIKAKRVSEINKILKDKTLIAKLVREDLEEILTKHGDKRKCPLVKESLELEYNAEDYIVQEEVYAIVTQDGWIKRIRQSNELGSTRLREGDAIARAHALSTADSVIFVTNRGYLYSLRVDEFPSSSGYGDPIQKKLKFQDGEAIVESFGVRLDELSRNTKLPGMDEDVFEVKDGDEVILLSEKGLGFATRLNNLQSTKKQGKRLMKIKEGDKLIAALLPDKRLLMFTEAGSALSIASKEIPSREGASIGVLLMSVRTDDKIVGAVSAKPGNKITMSLSSGKDKDIAYDQVTQGRRGLKGTKASSRAKINSVKRK